MDFKLKLLLTILGVSILFSGCSHKLNKNYALKKDSKESVFVMGVNSNKFALILHPGDVKNESFSSKGLSAAFMGRSENGYIINSTEGNNHIGFKYIAAISEETDQIIFQQPICDGIKTPVFKVPEGKVVYVGDVNLQYADGKIEYKMDSNFEKAEKFINENYPNLKGKLEKINVKEYSTKPCVRISPLQFIPVAK